MKEQEIFDKLLEIIHISMPGSEKESISMDTVINRDLGVDSMNFVLIVCKIEAAFDIRIPDKVWPKLSTVRDVVNEIQKRMSEK